MLTIQELEKEIARLPSEELARLRAWFDEFDAQAWERQFEADANSGKLDQLANEAIIDFKSGKYREL
jgi:hypothetical protein